MDLLTQENLTLLGTIAGALVAGCSFFIAHTETRNVWWYRIIEFVALTYGKAKDK